jgi:hypothetical protein
MLLLKTMIGVHYIDDKIEPQGKSCGETDENRYAKHKQTKKILTTRGRTANFVKFWLLALQKGRKKGIISNSTKGEMEA